MENTTITSAPRSQLSVAFRYAIICSLITIIYFLVLYVLKMETNKAAGWVSYLILIIVMFFGIKDYRDKDLSGFIPYGKALSTGILIAFFTGIIYAIFSYIFFTFIDTNFMTLILHQSEQQMVDRGMSQDQIDKAMSMSKKFVTPTAIAIFSVLGYAFIGLIISLVESGVLKKDNPEMPQA